MKESEKELQTIDREKIKTAVKLHTPIEITTYTIPRAMDEYIRIVMTEFLEECNQQHMTKYLSFSLGELLTNAKKANTKRVYFLEKKLDINNPDDYAKGMKNFKEETLDNIDYYLAEQKKAGFYIKLSLLYTENSVVVEIRNNSILNEEERERIQNKLDSVKQYKNENDVYNHVIDQTEGAGLGIIIIVLMLQKVGLKKEDYKVFTTDTETITKITLPLNTEVQTGIETACLECVKTQNKIPVFEEDLEELTLELKENQPDKKKIVSLISKNVTLTSLLLKHACKINSDCIKISQAMELIGFGELSSIFNKSNSDITLIKKSADKEMLWKHSYMVAFYAYNFVKNFCKDEFSEEKVYVFALLHDIECIIMEFMTQDQEEKIKSTCDKKGISEKAYSMIKNNCVSGQLGCLISQKWGLPAEVTEVIRYHHTPQNAPKKIRRLVSLIYLADLIDYYAEEKIDFYQIDEKVRKEFSIDTESKLKTIIQRVREKA